MKPVCECFNGRTKNPLANLSCVEKRTLLSGDVESARKKSANLKCISPIKNHLTAQNLNDVGLHVIDSHKSSRYEGRDLVGIPASESANGIESSANIRSATFAPDPNIQARA